MFSRVLSEFVSKAFAALQLPGPGMAGSVIRPDRATFIHQFCPALVSQFGQRLKTPADGGPHPNTLHFPQRPIRLPPRRGQQDFLKVRQQVKAERVLKGGQGFDKRCGFDRTVCRHP